MKAIIFAALVLMPHGSVCERMKSTDTLFLHGHRQHAQRFIECSVGHWPNVDSEFIEAPSGYRILK